jgi:hypothetical protein
VQRISPPPSAPAGYLDRFAAPTCDPGIDWGGSHGSLDWSGAAGTANDGGSPCSGFAQIRQALGSYRLHLNGDVEISRAVDLSSFAVRSVRFRYRTDGTFDATHYRRGEMSDDAGASWNEVGRIDAPGDGTYALRASASLRG